MKNRIKRRVSLLAAFLAVGLATFSARPAWVDLYNCPASSPEFGVVTDQNSVVIYGIDFDGRFLVWRDQRNGEQHIRAYDLATNAYLVVSETPADQGNCHVSDGVVIWKDHTATQMRMHVKDLTGRLATAPVNPVVSAPYISSLDISGDWLIWSESTTQGGMCDLYATNLSTGEGLQIPGPGNKWGKIFGNLVVFNSAPCANLWNCDWDVYGFDLLTRTTFPIEVDPEKAVEAVDLSGDLLLLNEKAYSGHGKVYVLNLKTREESMIANDAQGFAISGHTVVYRAWPSEWGVIYDLCTGDTCELTTTRMWSAVMNENYVFWCDRRPPANDIYQFLYGRRLSPRDGSEIVCPQNIFTGTDPGRCSAVVNYPELVARRNCEALTVVCEPPSGSDFPKGTTTVTCVAIDDADNASACSFTVTVDNSVAFADTFDDGVVDSAKWVAHGFRGGVDGLGSGSWEDSFSEQSGVDGYLETRVWGPATGNTYGAEAWIRTRKNFNDGNRWLLNFDWSTPVTGNNGKGYAIMMAGGNYPDSNRLIYRFLDDTEPHYAVLWQNVPSGPPWPGDPPDVPFSKVRWSVLIEPSGSATLYQAPDAQGVAFRLVSLDQSCPWYMMFLVDSVTSAGYSAGDCSFRLYDFSAKNLSRTPELVCPQDLTLGTAPGQCSTVIDYPAPVVSDNCADVQVACEPPSGSAFPKGSTAITCIATVGANIICSCSFTLTVNDDEPPKITCPSDITVSCGPEPLYPVTFSATATDNCDPSPRIIEVSDVITPGACTGTYSQTKTWKAVDACGNESATVSQTIQVIDTTGPHIPSVPAETTVECSAVPQGAPTLPATDNCDTAVTVALLNPDTIEAGNCAGHYTITRSWTATDACGNITTATQTIHVTDTTAPEIICPVLPGEVECFLPVSRTNAAASDYCGTSIITWATNGVQIPEGTDSLYLGIGCYTITWTATDACGNSSTCTKIALVKPNLDLTYTGDSMVFTAGPTISTVPVSLTVHLAPPTGTPCVTLTDLRVGFEVWTTTQTPSLVMRVTSAVNVNGDAGTLVTLSTATEMAQTYEIRATLFVGTCDVGANDISGQLVVVDFGSTTRRVVGGGWIANGYSDNGKGTFGFVAGYTTKDKTTLKGNSIFMLHNVAGYNWKVKDTAWNTETLSFYHNPAMRGMTVDSARFTCKGVVQQIDAVTGAVVGDFGNARIVVDVFDGDLYTPATKDRYSISVYNDDLLWWGGTGSLRPLGNDGPGGGNIKVFSE